MREHPRWPSSSCVAAHFGTWSAALEEAALPAGLTFGTTVPERVLAARALAARGCGLGGDRRAASGCDQGRHARRCAHGGVEEAWTRLGPVPA